MFLVDEDFGDGLLPWQEDFGGEEVRPETSGRAPISPDVLSKPPRSSSALGLVLWWLLVSGGSPGLGAPLSNTKWKRAETPRECRAPFPGEEQPLPTPPPSPHGEAGLQRRRAQRSAKSPRNGPSHPQMVKDPPKQSSTEQPSPNADPWRGAAAGVQSHLPSWERAWPWLLGQPKNVLK